MAGKRDKSLFILFNKHQARYFKRKFSKEEREQFEVIAFDGIVSMVLSQYTIKHHSTESLIKEGARREILTTSTHLLIEKMNSALIQLNRDSDAHMIDFFDCVKYQKFLEFLSIIYYRHYLKKLFSLFQPSRVVIFVDTSLLTILLNDICEEQDVLLHRHPLPRYYRSIQSVHEGLPFVTKKRGVLFHLFRKISGHSLPLKNISSQLKMRKDSFGVALVTPFDNKKTLTNMLGGFHTLIKKPFTIIVPLRKNFQREGFLAVKKEPHALAFDLEKVSLTKKEREEVHSKEFSSYLLLLLSDIFHSRKNIADLNTFTNAFDLRAWYCDFISTSRLFENLFSSLCPSIFMGDNFYDFTTRVGISRAERRGIQTCAVTKLHEELFSPPYHSFRDHILNKNLPHLIAVHRQNTAVSILQHRLVDNPTYVPSVQIIDQESEHHATETVPPNKGLAVLFTTQQHIYTFDYIKIVSRVVRTLSGKAAGLNIHLIIKPHPVEYTFLYTLATRKRDSAIEINKSTELDELFATADVLVTSHSFTAFEALSRKKKVILLSFSRRAVEPDILLYRPPELTENPLVTDVHSADELEAALREYAVMKR